MIDERISVSFDDDYVVSIFINGELHYQWFDDSNIHCPEDLTWSRTIEGVFFAGVEAGEKLSQENKEHGAGPDTQ